MKPKPVQTFSITPALPERLKPLWSLAYNLRWAWKYEIIELFMRLDIDLWESTNHNPVLMLGKMDQERLEALARDEGFVAHLNRVDRYIHDYMAGSDTAWFARQYSRSDEPQLAYFSLEFGITECLTIFAGGLGILAGDHLKSASDLGLPLVGVGLLYQQGYFRQYLNQAGWQQEAYEENDFSTLPLVLERDKNDDPIIVSVDFPGRQVYAQIWRTQVGRVALYLLDTNILQNTRPEDRDITDQLYGGDNDLRIRQEILLGIGGYDALQKLGINPTVYHMNEGHSAFLALEHIARLMHTHGLSFDVAKEAAVANFLFTTHTPVPAGHDRFSPQMMQYYFGDYVARELGIPWNDFMALGRENPYNHNETFCMTVLALRLAAFTNAVSELHGEVSRDMWQVLWPDVPTEEIPISHVTNGIHILSWISRDMKVLYDRYLGPRWREDPGDHAVWQASESIAPDELWRTHERRRERLVSFVRTRLHKQLVRRGASQREVLASEEVLDPDALTIGFARRFATYKRATLLLRDKDRLASLLNNPDRPVQFIFAGKAHPKDNPGKSLIQEIVNLSRQDEFRNHLVFLEDYDMTMARYMVQGVDVWLNTPRRPREASGTSGMKAAANGVLNLSILDGWWDEAYTPEAGWAIGRGETYSDLSYQDQVEAEALYELLEQDVVPMFYDRVGRIPRQWIDKMKADISSICYYFNTNRMVAEYTENFYIPLVARSQAMHAEEFAAAKTLAQWKQRIRQEWDKAQVEKVVGDEVKEYSVGEMMRVQAQVKLGDLTPSDVCVQLYVGLVNSRNEIDQGRAIDMRVEQDLGEGSYLFSAETECETSGLHGYTVRLLPDHIDLITHFQPGFIHWAS